jgi:ribosomal peptide maturation radical SAM protein 1
MSRPPKIALVVMPWAIPDTPPLGVAVLKSWLARHGVEARAFYFNLRFNRWAGNLIDTLSVQPYSRFGEWAFAHNLFGPGGSGELPHDFQSAWTGAGFDDYMKAFPRERLERLVDRDIPEFLEHCAQTEDWGAYDLVGFSSMFFNHAASLALAKRIKERHPRTPIVFGGANVEGEMGDATLKGCEWVDFVVDGEGELALLELARSLAAGGRGEGIARVSRRHEGRVVPRDPLDAKPVDLSLLPPPDHDDYFRERQACGLTEAYPPRVTFEASRGCWWGQKQHCTFCGLNGQAMAYRSKPVEQVVEEISVLHRRYRAFKLHGCDNILGYDHLQELLPALRRSRQATGADWQVFFEVKSNLTAAQLEALKDAGVTAIQPGIDSLSTAVLKLMRKGVTAIQNVAALKEAAGRVNVMWGLIWGFAGEDPEEYRKIADLIPSLTHLTPAAYHDPIRIDRFSPFHFDWERLGTRRPEANVLYRYLYPESRFRLDEIAYFFDMRRLDGAPDPGVYAEPLITPAVKWWQSVYARNYFAHRSGDGFVELYDSRPFGPGRGLEHRTALLTGLEAAVYEACAAPRSLEAVVEACRTRHPACTAADAATLLEDMASKRWVMREEGLSLALSVPVGRLPAEQSVALSRLMTAALVYDTPRLPGLGPAPAAAQAAASSSK